MSILFSVHDDFLHDESSEYLQCSNSSGFVLLELLGVEADYCGEIAVDDLLNRLSLARTTLVSRADEFESAPRETRGAGGAAFFDCGVSAERYARFLDRLEQIAQYARTKNFATITWG
jgi:hypothetical protein